MDVMFRTGTLATLMFTQECHPHMKGKDSAIVNFASGGAISGDIGYAAYAPAKEGVRVLTKVAARELGPDGIRVNAVCPAAKTRLMQDWIDENPDVGGGHPPHHAAAAFRRSRPRHPARGGVPRQRLRPLRHRPHVDGRRRKLPVVTMDDPESGSRAGAGCLRRVAAGDAAGSRLSTRPTA